MSYLYIVLLLAITANSSPIFNLKSQNKSDVLKYLKQFGYYSVAAPSANESSAFLIENNENDALVDALTLFQEYNNLSSIDGTLNNETLKLLSTPRCGLPDAPYQISKFVVYQTKWNKTNLTWYFSLGNSTTRGIAKAAFDIWELDSNLKFSHTYRNADIMISFSENHHRYSRWCQGGGGGTTNNNCGSSFDGLGGVLAHAFSPTMDGKCVEIHLDKSENWYMGMNMPPPDGKSSLLYVLVHEIGHTLGLDHSSNPDAIMHAYYNHQGHSIYLHPDDINGIQYLYGLKHSYAPIPTTTTTTIATTTTSTTIATPSPTPTSGDKFTPKTICDVQFKKNIFLILKNKLYIIYKKWVWILQLSNNKLLSNEPILIKNYIHGLPDGFTNFDTAYQRPNGDLVFFIGHVYYIFSFPGFNLKSFNTIDTIGLNSKNQIHAAFTTYTGKTYIFYDNNLYAEIDECSFFVKNYGAIADTFVGLGQKVDSAFRYINGMMYFLQKNTYFEYNEFTHSLIKMGKTSDLFTTLTGIECPNVGILTQLKQLLSKLINNDVQLVPPPDDDDYIDI